MGVIVGKVETWYDTIQTSRDSGEVHCIPSDYWLLEGQQFSSEKGRGGQRTSLPYAYSQSAQVSMGVIHDMVTSSSGMVSKMESSRVAHSRPKYPYANHCADSTTWIGVSLEKTIYSRRLELTRSWFPARMFVAGRSGYLRRKLPIMYNEQSSMGKKNLSHSTPWSKSCLRPGAVRLFAPRLVV